MDPPRQPQLQLPLESAPSFSNELYNELSSAVKGTVLRPSDARFAERAKTFNGKLKPHPRVLVSPLGANDVSAVVKFCVKHGLSPSVRAGGYGIAGWAVAGDVIIDMSMMADIDIEAPKPIAEGAEAVVDYTRITDVAPSDSTSGADPIGAPQAVQASPPNESLSSPERPGKRRREDRSPSAEAGGADTSTTQGPYDGASPAVASFLRGPPLPPEPGETPRQPPTNRPRLHSPQPGAIELDETPLRMPALSENTRQFSGESTSSDSSARLSAFGAASDSSVSTTIASPPGEDAKSTSAGAEPREPFAYMSPTSTPAARLPMYTATDPVRYGSQSGSAESGSSVPPPIPGPALPPLRAWSGQVPSTGLPSLPTLGIPPLGSISLAPSLPPLGAFGLSDSLTGTPQQHFQPVHPHAYVTFGAGMRQKDIDQYTAGHPLEGTNAVTGERKAAAVPYHIPMSAHPVGSSIMLLAGFGFISRMYGLSIDNLVEVEMVLADGRIVIVNADEDPELWWAIRGAGPAFGIATRYKARAFPVPVVFAGNLVYRFHRATAPSLIKHFRDCIKQAPRELYANVLLTAGPADKDSLVVIQMCYAGPRSKGMEFLQAVSSWDGERCLLNEVNEKSFLRQQDSIAQVLRGKAGRQWFLRSALITSLPDEVINRTVLEFADTPIGCTWLFELAGGAIGDFEDTCLPKEQREAAWTVAALHQWDMGIDDPRCITTAEQWMGGTIKQVSVGGPYPTFLGRHEPPARTMACYGKNWARLAALKRKYDPTNLFRNNFWPLDADGQPIEPLANEPPSP